MNAILFISKQKQQASVYFRPWLISLCSEMIWSNRYTSSVEQWTYWGTLLYGTDDSIREYWSNMAGKRFIVFSVLWVTLCVGRFCWNYFLNKINALAFAHLKAASPAYMSFIAIKCWPMSFLSNQSKYVHAKFHWNRWSGLAVKALQTELLSNL